MQESETTTVKARDYLPLLGLVSAAVFGVCLMCSTAVVGINDINNAVLVGTPTEGLVDFVISNMNTMIVETAQAFSIPIINNTSSPTDTSFVTNTNTSTNIPPATFFVSSKTATRPPRFSTNTPIPAPTRTRTPVPSATNTAIPTATNTPIPTVTNTPIPPNTDTPVPPTDTDTPIPPDTDTPIPPDTDTPAPPPTDTETPLPFVP